MSSSLKIRSFTSVKDGKEIKFKIQEISEYEEVIEFLLKNYVPDEPLHKAAGITQSNAAIEEYKKIMLHEMHRVKHQIDACYVDDGGDKLRLAGVSMMVLTKREDPELDLSEYVFETPEIKSFIVLVVYFMEMYNMFKEDTIDAHFSGRGVVVDSAFRGLGIAGELLKVRMEICKELNVPVTDAWMNAYGTQKAAAKLGWEVVKEVQFEDVEKETGIKFIGSPKTTKFMLARVSN